MRVSISWLAFLGFSGAQSVKVMEALPEVPEGWEQIGHPDPSSPLLLRIAMSQPNQALFEQTLYAISDPSHARYGQHLKRDELKALLRPTTEASTAIMDWLLSFGLPSKSINDDGEWINFVANVSDAENMLDTRFGLYRNEVGDERIRTLSYSLPEKLHQYVDMIQPTTRFGQLRGQRVTWHDKKVIGDVGKVDFASASCSSSVTPACLRSLYKVPSQPLTGSGSVGFMAFNNFLQEYPRYNDLEDFENEYATYASGQNFTWTSISGGKLDQSYTGDSGEANLDAQYLLALGAPIPMHAYSTGGLGPLVPDLDQPSQPGSNEPYLDTFNYLLSLPDDSLPHTITTSYGEDEQSVPLSYRTNVCNLIGQLGARGVSIIFSSGDTGVASACQTNDGKKTTRFLPIFPAACPYVTSVGAVSGTAPESAVSFSSGGFSDTWARPSYQNQAVTTFLNQLGTKWNGLYNKTGRGFPDVAAQGVSFHVVDQGSESYLSGTSASSPTFAGIIALLNANRLQAGKKPLGFLNPWIYSSAYKGLNDITSGHSTGCTGSDSYSGKSTPYVAGASWTAVTGWDPVTGYGTPDYSKLLPLAMNA